MSLVKYISNINGIFSFFSKINFSNLIKGIKAPNNENYIIQFTCKKCDNRLTRMFTKHAYHKGIVLIQCDKCLRNHLIADNIGWFNDNKNKPENIEEILKEKKEKYIKTSIQGLIEITKKELNVKI